MRGHRDDAHPCPAKIARQAALIQRSTATYFQHKIEHGRRRRNENKAVRPTIRRTEMGSCIGFARIGNAVRRFGHRVGMAIPPGNCNDNHCGRHIFGRHTLHWHKL